MALTVAQVGNTAVMGNLKAVVADVTFDASYDAGGEALNPSTLGLSFVRFLVADGAKGFNVMYDYTNSKLLAYGSTAGTEVVAATNLSAVSCRVFAVGA